MQEKFKVILLFTVTLLLTTCKQSTDFSSISDPRERWEAYQLTNYKVEQQRNCFCILGGKIFIVTIQNNKITTVTDKETGQAIESNQFQLFKTVPQLFEFIASINPDSVATFRVDYDAKYGYPGSIYVDYDIRVADEEMGYETRNLIKL